MKKSVFVAAVLACSALLGDWAGNQRYAKDNQTAPKGAVVLFGDSITDL